MDQHTYPSDKKLTDRGWSSMREALDAEMPEERRRPVALLWILALLLPLGGGLGWLLFHPGDPAGTTPLATTSGRSAPQPTTPQSATTITTLPSAMPATPAMRADVNSAFAASNPAAAIMRQGNKSTAPLPAMAQTATPQRKDSPLPGQPLAIAPTSQPFAVHDPHPEETGQAPAQDIAAPAATAAIPAAQTTDLPTSAATETATPTNLAAAETTELPAANTPAPSSPATEAPQPPLSTDAAPALPQGASALTATTDNAPADVSWSAALAAIKPVVQKITKNWSFGASAGILSDASSAGYTGAAAGLAAEWKASRHWGLRSGLGYQYRTLRGDDRPILSVSSGTYAEATGDLQVVNTVSGTTSTNTPVYIPLAHLHRLEIPVLAYWQPTEKFRLLGGLSWGNNLYAQGSGQSLANNQVLTVADGAASKQLNQKITQRLRGWDTRINVGLGIKPWRNVELNVLYLTALHNNSSNANLLYDSGSPSSMPSKYGAFNITSDVTRPAVESHALLQVAATVFF